jgi:hypothetical protein
MAKFLTAIMVLAVSLSALTQAATYGGGSGTADDPYQIWTPQQLNTIGLNPADWGMSFKLMADIDMSAYTGTQYNIIGTDSYNAFRGMFNGNKYVISNLTYETTASVNYVGLFGCTENSTIQELGIENVSLSSSGYCIGGLVGRNSGSIIGCYATGLVSGTGSYNINVGGLAGCHASGMIIACYAAGSVNGRDVIGGLVGGSNGSLTACYSTGSVSGQDDIGGLVGSMGSGMLNACYTDCSVSGTKYVGGLIGNNNSGSLIDCYAIGSVDGIDVVGGLVGYNSGSINSCFWDIQTCGTIDGVGNVNPDPAGVKGKTTVEMQSLSTFTNIGWDFVGESTNGLNDYWQIDINDYPRLTLNTWMLEGEGISTNPYVVTNAVDLGRVWLRPSAYYRLNGNLDLSGTSWSSAVVPLFTGFFDGQGFVISHLTINQPNTKHVGLFGYIESCGQIQNLGVENVNIIGCEYVGGLVGQNYSGFLTNCHATGLVASDIGYYSCVGGLVGSNSGTLTTCYATGSVAGIVSYDSCVGGLVGGNDGAIIACFANSSSEGYYAGGLVGRNDYGSVLTSCYAFGSVGGGYYVGGLVGHNDHGTINSCYATGLVAGETNSYGPLVGGLIGCNLDFLNACFWDIQTSGKTNGVGGGISSDVTGKTTAQMQMLLTFTSAGWDFTDTDGDPADWYMPSGYYPQLAALPLVPIPNVAGLTQAIAQSAIQSAGLSMGGITFVSSQTVPAGVVISQSIAQGTLVNPGLTLHLAISLGSYTSGSGTITDPYQIASKADLLLLANCSADYDKYFILTEDVDMEGQVFNKALISLKEFVGTFDGNNHKITHFTIDGGDNNRFGLFSQIGLGAKVKNLGLENCSVNGSLDSHDVGGLCGVNSGTISNCYNLGNVTGAYYVGGLCGINNGIISNCYNTGNVTGKESVGGLCGSNFGLINESYTTGIICGSYNVGGICGYNDLEGVLSTCHAAGDINGYSGVGGLCGSKVSGTINNCYATGMVTGYDGLGGLCGESYGDIVLRNEKIIKSSIKNSYATGAVIGNDTSSNYIGGLCGKNWATLMNCYATGTVSGNKFVGGLCGINSSILRDCYAAGNIIGTDYSYSLGGLCGYSGTLIQNCYALGSVFAGSNSYNLGGLCGEINRCQVINCYAAGTVTGGADSYALGGLLGSLQTTWVTKCYAAGAVTGGEGAYNTGGLCGQSYEAQFNHCFWDTEASGQITSAGGTGKTTAQMQTRQTFVNVGWDFTNETENGPVDIWRMCMDGEEYPKFARQFSGTGDFTCPAGVGMEDLSVFVACWLEECELKGDITLDDIVNMNDIQYLSMEWLFNEGTIVTPYYADVTGDLNVNLEDLIVVADQWLQVSCRRVDLNHDDAVNLADLSILAANWLKQ